MSTDAVKKKRIAREIQKERVHLGYNNKKKERMLWAVLSYCPATGRNGNEQRVTETARKIGKDRDRLREKERTVDIEVVGSRNCQPGRKQHQAKTL